MTSDRCAGMGAAWEWGLLETPQGAETVYPICMKQWNYLPVYPGAFACSIIFVFPLLLMINVS